MKRREGLAKLSGRERYVDDIERTDCLWGATVRSPVARGRLRGVHFGEGVDWSEIVVVDPRDLPGDNVVALIEDDQPVLAAEEIRHVHEAVVLLAHPSREYLRRAVAAVELDIESLPPMLDFRREPSAAEVQHGDDNVFKRLAIDKGDVDSAFASAAHVVEGVYETGAQEHVYLETQGMMAWVDDGVVTVQGSMQCPYYIEKAMRRALDLPAERVRVIQSATGGGFGGKEEYPSTIALHASLLAMKAGRPVKIVYDRGEDMAATTKRHPSRVRHRTALDADGRLLAQEIDVLLDAGAYATLSAVVLSRGVIHAAGPYRCDNVRIRGRAVLTNAVPFGAFRGFGAPQTHFANERHMDVIASRLRIDPVELRRRNLLEPGDSTATSQVPREETDLHELLDHGLELARYREKRAEHERFNAGHSYLRRGIGLACFHHGAGFTGSGEAAMGSVVHVAGLADGTVEVRAASTEMGQGTTTIFTQIASDRLGCDAERVLVARPDTHRVPNSGPTVASRTAMVVGRLVELACDDLRQKLGLDEGGGDGALRDALVAWHASHDGDELVGSATYEAPPGIVWDDETYRGEAYGSYGWATYVAEVEVDLRTYTARVIDFVAVQEIGRVLNEVLARGQIQGGVVQAIGWALLEECRFEDGAMRNNQLTNYIIPTSEDVPPIRVGFLENPYPHGAQGAKGIGELPMDGPAPAIANAVAAAVGCDPRTIPLTPERLMELIEKGEAA